MKQIRKEILVLPFEAIPKKILLVVFILVAFFGTFDVMFSQEILLPWEKNTEQKQKDMEALEQALHAFRYPIGRTYATFSTVSHSSKKIDSYKLLLWTNQKQVSIFSVLHPQNGLQERIRFFPNKEYFHIFWTSRQRLLTRNIVSDLNSRFEIALENSPLFFTDLHPLFLLSQYQVIVDEHDDIFSELDVVRGKTLPHARRYLFEQLRDDSPQGYRVIVLHSKIAALHDRQAVAQSLQKKPYPYWEQEPLPYSYYGYMAVYLKDNLIHRIEHFDSNGFYLKSIEFQYKALPIKSTQEKKQIDVFPVLWEVVEPKLKKITRVEFLYNSPDKPVQDYYFSDDYFTRP